MQVACELHHACGDCVRCDDQVVQQRVGARRRDSRELERQVWREALVLRGYLLIDDVPRIVQRASDTWDFVVVK